VCLFLFTAQARLDWAMTATNGWLQNRSQCLMRKEEARQFVLTQVPAHE
jgi:hypothetical protein